FPAAGGDERAARIEENRRAVDEAAALGAEVLVLVCGAAPDKDIAAARRMVADGIAALVPYARERGVRLGIEPVHPGFAAEHTGYAGPIEVEIFNEGVWDTPLDTLVPLIKERFLSCV